MSERTPMTERAAGQAAGRETGRAAGRETGRTNARTDGWRALADDLRRWIGAHPFAVGFAAVFAAVNLAVWVFCITLGHALPLMGLSTTIARFNLTHLFISLFLTRGPIQLVFNAVALLLMLATAEPLLGRARMVCFGVVSTVVGVALGLAACAALALLLQGTAVIYHIRFTLSPLALGVGALMAASAFSRPLWRRRMRVIGYAAIVAAVLFSGNPGTYCTLAAALYGQLMGAIAMRHGNGAAPARSMRWQLNTSYEARRIFGAIALVLALGPILAIISPTHAGPLSSLALLMSPAEPNHAVLAQCLADVTRTGCFFQFDLLRTSMPGAVLQSLLPTAVLVIMAWGLYRGRRLAAWVTIGCNTAAALLAALYYFVMPLADAPHGAVSLLRHGAIAAGVANMLLPAGFAVAVLVSLRHFPIRTDPKRLATGAVLIAVTFAACVGVYLLFGLLRPQAYHPAPTLRELLIELPGRFIPIGFLSRTRLMFAPASVVASIVYQGVGLVFWAAVLIACLQWMRGIAVMDRRAQTNAGRLVEHCGESMSFMATWEGNHYWMSPTGRSAVAYRVIGGIALTCTGPFGDRSEWMHDLREFTRFCVSHSWSPVFYAVHRDQRDALLAEGWYSLEIGGEMVVDPRQWKTTGKKWQDIRTAINKAKRDGITDVLTTFEQAGPDVREQIEEISEQWTSLKALPEMRFTLGGVEELRDPRVHVLYAIDADGTVLGVTSWLPTWRDGRIIGWTLDFMRHRTDSPNGIMEFLIARMAERLRDQGLADPDNAPKFMSLSAAPLAGMNPERDNLDAQGRTDTGTAMLQHALQIVADWMEPAYGFHSLFNFKRKFQPTEEPVYVCYPDPAALPQLGLAVVRAYVPSLTAAQALGMLRTLRR